MERSDEIWIVRTREARLMNIVQNETALGWSHCFRRGKECA